MTKWEINTKLDNIIEDNYIDDPWEGGELFKEPLKQDIIDFIKTLSFTDLIKIHEMI